MFIFISWGLVEFHIILIFILFFSCLIFHKIMECFLKLNFYYLFYFIFALNLLSFITFIISPHVFIGVRTFYFSVLLVLIFPLIKCLYIMVEQKKLIAFKIRIVQLYCIKKVTLRAFHVQILLYFSLDLSTGSIYGKQFSPMKSHRLQNSKITDISLVKLLKISVEHFLLTKFC